MTVSTDGEICYGWLFEENYQFPWDDEVYLKDENEWWMVVRNFSSSVMPYDEQGEYKPGFHSGHPDVASHNTNDRFHHDLLGKMPIHCLLNWSMHARMISLYIFLLCPER